MQDGSPRRDALRLDRVVLRGVDDACPDPLRARQRLERTLAATDWTPAGLPPGALLFVRRLRVHGPGFDVAGSAAKTGRDPFADDRAFASRIADSLRAQGRAARRPWSDAQAVDADAVWFEEEHELAACLVRDWLRGVAPQRWWWRSVLAGEGIDAWLRTRLLSRGEGLAPTLQRLAAVSLAAVWVARMDDADARIGFDALARAYALPRAHDAVADATQDAPDRQGSGAARSAHRASPTPAAARRRLRRIVPELDAATWRPAQARLLAYGLALLRAPAEVRTRAFAEDIAAWRPVPEHMRADPAGDGALDVGTIAPGHDDAGHDMAGQAMPSRRRAAAPAHPGPAATSHAGPDAAMTRPFDAPRPHAASSMATVSALAPGSVATPDAVAARDAQAQVPAATTSAMAMAGQAGEATLPAMDRLPAMTAAAGVEGIVAPVMPPAFSRTLPTTHGGLFYVLNAALSLGLYGDFSMPRAHGLSLSPWNLLAWLGRHWFGRAFRRDPLWDLLADLAGRSPKRAPTWRIDPPSRWEPGDDWLRPWAPVAMLAHGVDRRAGRLHLLHPDGFAVFDVPRDTRLRPAAQARALCLAREGVAEVRLRPSSSTRSLPADPGLRWLHRFADYLAARCMRALGTASPRKAMVLLCRHAAEVRCDAGRVEVALSLSALPLPVRIAGLDRDPGWIPAAGRDIRFHFS